MTVQSLIQRCAELGIKLELKGDEEDRVLVDAPKGALTTELREALAAHKPELLAILKTQQQADKVPAPMPANLSEQSEGQASTGTTQNSQEATFLIREESLAPNIQIGNIESEVKKLLTDSQYDVNIISATQAVTRQTIARQLLAVLGGSDSPTVRAAAARELGTFGDAMATEHLIAALEDEAPEVRRAATESLGQIGDPAAISPLNDLLLRETDPQLPEAVIRHAINSIAFGRGKSAAASEEPLLQVVEKITADQEPKVQKREIFDEYLSSLEKLQSSSPSPSEPLSATPVDNSLNAAEERLPLEEEALRNAAQALEQQRLETEAARKMAEDEEQTKAQEEALVRIEVLARQRGEDEARRQLKEEASRKAAEEAKARSEEEVRRQAEHEVRLQVEDEIRRRAEEEARKLAEEETLARAAEEARVRVEVEANIRAEQEAKRKTEEEAKQREEAARVRAADEAARRAEEGRLRQETDERQRAEEARLRVEQETLMQVAAELSRRRSELEEARQQAEEEARLLLEAQQRASAEEESRRQFEADRQRLAIERVRMQVEQEEQRLAVLHSVKTKAEEEAQQRAETEQRLKAEIVLLTKAEEQQRLRIEAEIRRRSEAEGRLKGQEAQAEAEVLRATQEIRLKVEEQARRRAEVEASLKQEEARLKAEQEAREEARQLAELTRARAEEETLRHAEVEARLKEEEARFQAQQEARVKLEAEAQRLAEGTRLKAEEEALRRAEAEARLKAEEARFQLEQEARAKAEEEARQLADRISLRADEESRRRTEVEARLKDAEARLLADQEARARAEEEMRRLAEELRSPKEEEVLRRAAAEAGLKEHEALFRAEQKGRLEAESEAEGHRLAEVARAKAEEEARLRDEATARLEEEEAFLRAEEETEKELAEQGFEVEVVTPEYSEPDFPWVEVNEVTDRHMTGVLLVAESMIQQDQESVELSQELAKAIDVVATEKGLTSAEDEAAIPSEVLKRLSSSDAAKREAALSDVGRIGGEDAFRSISNAFDDPSLEVRNAAARALFALHPDRAATFTRALREGSPERRRKIGQALAASGLAGESVGNLTGESREKTYDAFSLLFLMAKAGEIQPLLQAIEDYPNLEVRIAVVKLLALSGQPEIIPTFRRLAVRGSLPPEVRSAVMESIYQISNQTRESTPSAA
jgi:hypothetical protein